MKEKNVYLPQVKSVHLDFDKVFIHKCLKSKNGKYLKNLNWPEAVKAIYREIENAEIKLLHIESCCRKAREESVTPYKNAIWDLIIKHGNWKEA